jgi:3-hydroxy-3-methylglutaryl CoA synthase
MIGISSYGAYIPLYRLSWSELARVWGGGATAGEKAVANADEDSLTMGVEAARNCLKGVEKSSIDALYFASTTPPFKEKQSASIMAAALDLREDIITADFADSLRSGTIALRMALDAVKAGSARKVLVVASDCRIPPPNSAFEPLFGDGAVAFLIGEDGVAVEIEGSYYLTTEFIDNTWRMEYDKITRNWESRFMREESYLPYFQKATSNLLKAHNLSSKDFAKAVLYAPDRAMHRAIAGHLGLDAKTQIQDPLFDKIGNTGVAFAPMTLVGALEEAKPGDRVLLVNYGDGVDAHVLRVTGGIEKLKDGNGVKKNLESKLMLDNYGKYIKFRNLMEFEYSLDVAPRTALPELWRHRNWVYRFHGVKCQKCGKVQFPIPKACIYCQAGPESLEEVPLSDKKATLVTFSIDERAPVVDSPNVLAAVLLEGGGRFYSQMTDRDANNLKVGMPMEATFRRIHDACGVHNYFWKCRPVRG